MPHSTSPMRACSLFFFIQFWLSFGYATIRTLPKQYSVDSHSMCPVHTTIGRMREYVTRVDSILFCLLSILCVFPRVSACVCVSSVHHINLKMPIQFPVPLRHSTLSISFYAFRPPRPHVLSISRPLCCVPAFLPHFGCFSYPLTVTHFSSLNRSHACPFSPTVHFIGPHTFPTVRSAPPIPFITWFVRLFISTVIRQLLFSRYLFNFIWLLFALALAERPAIDVFVSLFLSAMLPDRFFLRRFLPGRFSSILGASCVLCTLSRYSRAMAMSGKCASRFCPIRLSP